MSDVITRSALLTLAGLHLLYIGLIITLGWFLLAKPYRYLLIGLALMGWLWSVSAMVDFHLDDQGFLSWFLDPSAERNLTAIGTSMLLMLISVTALILLWRSRSKQPPWQRLYWLLLAVLFFFLATDEYASIHEHFDYWRQAYLALGGSVGLLSFIVLVAGEKSLRPYIALFIIGLASLGFAGVILDAFSNQNIIDIGSFNLDIFACHQLFLGVKCRDYSNTEELWELVGACVMWLSLMSVTYHWQPDRQRSTRRILALGGGLWAFLLIGWMWLFPLVENQLATPVLVRYDDVTITGYTVSQETIAPGDKLHVRLYVHTNHALQEDYSISVHLYTQPDAVSVAHDDMMLGAFVYPTRGWVPGWPVRNRFTLVVPDDLPGGVSYRLVAMLWRDDPMQSIPANESDHPTLLNNQIIVLQGMPMLPEHVPPSPINADYHFAEGFSLIGYEIPHEAQAGDTLTGRFWWQVENDIDTPLTYFIHVLNVETDAPFYFDQQPFGGHFPTTDWPAGLRAMDEWQFQLPPDMPAGNYRIVTGVYQSFSGERMTVSTADGQAVQDNAIILGDLLVRARE